MYLDPDESAPVSDRLVDQRFRPRLIDLTVHHQRTVDVVNAHRPVVRAADAAKRRAVPGRSCIVDVDELAGGVADGLNETGRGVVVART